MTKEIEDLKALHELLGAFLRHMDDESGPGSLAQRLSAEGLEAIGKVGSVMKRVLVTGPLEGRKSETALDLLRALVPDLSAFDSDDAISGGELMDYMADFYLLARSLRGNSLSSWSRLQISGVELN
jgi:hypothetical protein